MLLRFLVLAAVLAGSSAMADTVPGSFETGAHATVAAVIDGDTVVLDSGEEVRLVGIMAPKLSLGRESVDDQPLGREAEAALEALALGKGVTLAFGGARMDRHGRILAHLVLDDGTWVQGRLLETGMARVYSFADNRAAVAEMLALEAAAREAGLGLWAHPFYAVRDAERPAEVPIDSFELIEGVVLQAAEVDRRIFLNFGEDWREDVTATISPPDRAIFRAADSDPLALEGHRVRLRGWTGWRNGPNIEIDHPEQLEVLD